VPAVVEFVDIAGLVAGASKGEGLGNQFLSHIRETDAIVNVVRCFEDDNVIHVNGKVDPISDIEVIQTELCLADLATRRKADPPHQQARAAGDKEAIKLSAMLESCRARSTRPSRCAASIFHEGRAGASSSRCLITAKPAMFVGNVKTTASRTTRTSTACANSPRGRRRRSSRSAPTKAEIADMDDEDAEMFLAEMGQTEPGLNRLIRAGFTLLGLQTYFTAGVKEVRAWTVAVGDTAPQAAGVIHTDFEKRLHPRPDDRLRRLRRLQGRTRREGRRQDARGRQGIRRQGRRRAELPVSNRQSSGAGSSDDNNRLASMNDVIGNHAARQRQVDIRIDLNPHVPRHFHHDTGELRFKVAKLPLRP
jgi:ribosome-binding ATPase YchF (GTP1/OBG family)